MNTSNITNKVVVVTGAGQGIGRAIAERFASVGAKVVVNDINPDTTNAVVASINAAGQSAIAAVADVSDSAQVATVVDTAMSEYGKIDVLVNNAGVVGPMLHFFEADEAWWRRIVDINLTGHFLMSHPIARIMAKAGGGSIIHMSSGGATKAHRAFTAYDATKGGIEALTRAMALDLGPYGIRVNALMPGSIDTSGATLDMRIAQGQNIPLGRRGTSEDMTGAALFLASDDASYVTGDVIKVDGGLTSQQRSATVDIKPPSGFPKVETL